jgi:hypothetical protein
MPATSGLTILLSQVLHALLAMGTEELSLAQRLVGSKRAAVSFWQNAHHQAGEEQQTECNG